MLAEVILRYIIKFCQTLKDKSSNAPRFECTGGNCPPPRNRSSAAVVIVVIADFGRRASHPPSPAATVRLTHWGLVADITRRRRRGARTTLTHGWQRRRRGRVCMCSCCRLRASERGVRACVLCVFTLPYTVTDGLNPAGYGDGVHCTGDPRWK